MLSTDFEIPFLSSDNNLVSSSFRIKGSLFIESLRGYLLEKPSSIKNGIFNPNLCALISFTLKHDHIIFNMHFFLQKIYI